MIPVWLLDVDGVINKIGAGPDDIEHAANTGQAEPTGNCGCWCAVVEEK